MQAEKETSGIPTTIYYPSDFCAVFTTNSTLRSAACYFSLWLSGKLVFTNTFFSSVLRGHMDHDSASKWNHWLNCFLKKPQVCSRICVCVCVFGCGPWASGSQAASSPALLWFPATTLIMLSLSTARCSAAARPASLTGLVGNNLVISNYSFISTAAPFTQRVHLCWNFYGHFESQSADQSKRH